jgi:hypothetical protein
LTNPFDNMKNRFDDLSLGQMPLDPEQRIREEFRLWKISESDKVLAEHQRSPYKLKLLEMFWYLEDLLDGCDTYQQEDQWHHEREQTKFLNKLNGTHHYKKDG